MMPDYDMLIQNGKIIDGKMILYMPRPAVEARDNP